MNRSQTIEGRWYVFGEKKRAHFGVLTFDPESQLTLSVKIPRHHSSEEILLSFVEKRAKKRPVVYGFDSDNDPITLFGCGFFGKSMATGMQEHRIGCLAALKGCKASSWSNAKFKSACFNYSLLHRWMNRQGFEAVANEKGAISIAPKKWPLTEIALGEGAIMRLESTFMPSASWDGYSFETAHRVWFLFDKHLPIQTILDAYAYRFLHFLSLLTGSSVFIDKAEFYDRDVLSTATLLRCCSGISQAVRDKPSTAMVASFSEIEADYQNVIKKWFRLHDKLQPVVELYQQVRESGVNTAASRFLFLAQALEVYHSRSDKFTSQEISSGKHRKRVHAIVHNCPENYKTWLRDKLSFANQKNLATRIDEVLNLYPAEAKRLTHKIKGFPEKVRHTRNYYTHYGDELKVKGKISKGHELIRITCALQGLLGICLLKELGIEGNPIEKMIKRYTDLEITDLSDESQELQMPPNSD